MDGPLDSLFDLGVVLSKVVKSNALVHRVRIGQELVEYGDGLGDLRHRAHEALVSLAQVGVMV